MLFVENFQLIDNQMSTNYDNRCKEIIKCMDFYDISSSIDFDTNKYKIVLFGCRAISVYKKYNAKEIKIIHDRFVKLMSIKHKFFIIQDMHVKTYKTIETLCEILSQYSINIIFTFYNNKEAIYIRSKTPNCKHYHLPIHVDTNIFRIYDEIKCKDIDILLYGSIHPKHYPFRKRLFDLLKNNEIIKVTYIEHPKIFDEKTCDKGLALLLNRSKIAISTKSIYDYFLAKYIEITLCNCKLAGNIPTDYKNIFSKNMLELNEKMSDEKILNVLCDYLKNYDDKMNNQMFTFMEHVKSNFNLDSYANKILKIIINDVL
jgi:hypothetical protein